MSIFPKSIVLCFFINFFSEFSICYPSEEKIFSLVFFFNLLGLFNVFFGTLSAYGQTDLKRLIMYSSLTNIGYIFFCISSNIENSFFIAYSYIIHYTLALFILFRIFNEIEFFTNKKFSQ
jgi:formate hydrogenlyase subunit 3/multisubunit Na+/H+ antiporter MnhD subunit